jgi:hypothetical protein
MNCTGYLFGRILVECNIICVVIELRAAVASLCSLYLPIIIFRGGGTKVHHPRESLDGTAVFEQFF